MLTVQKYAQISICAALLLLLSTIATAQGPLTTNYTGNTGQQGNMFEVNAIAAVNITGFDIHFTGTADFEVWTLNLPGTYLADVSSNANWTLQASAPALASLGMNVPTPMGVTTNINIPAGTTQAIYVTAAPTFGTATVWYNTGVTQGAVHAANADMQILVGNGGGYFSNTIVGRGWNGTIHYSYASTVTDDLAVTAITAPIDSFGCDALSSAEQVSATITNLGTVSVPFGSLIQLDLVVDNGASFTEFATLAANLNQGDQLFYNFTTLVDLSAVGAHTIDVTVTYPGDLNNANDLKSKMVNSGGANVVTTFPWVENFDGAVAQNSIVPPAGWSQDAMDGTGADSDWYMHTGTTTSTNTGPPADATTGAGYYAYVEDSTGNFAQVNLLTPCLDLSSLTSPICSFQLFSFNSNPSGPSTQENFFSVDVITYPGGVVTTDLIGPIGHQATSPTWTGATWTSQAVNLSPYLGQTIQLRFRASNNNGGAGNTFYHDIGIDDVAILDSLPTPGQAPRAGLAIMDIENSLNGNLLPVGSGAGGPYYAGVTQGSSFTFSFEGEAGQPIAVIYGPLNPVSATYPGGIGQFDVGGPGVDGMGIPLNIAVFANAIGWAQAGFPGFPIDALFFTGASGTVSIGFTFPNFGIPSGSVVTTFQGAVASSAAPFVYISNAVQISVN